MKQKNSMTGVALLQLPIRKKSVAIFSAKGLGDGLLYMTLSHNLSFENEVVTFNSHLCELRRWFPNKVLLPFPENIEGALSSFDLIIASDHSPIHHTKTLLNKTYLIKESALNKKMTMVDNLVSLCKERFYLKEASPYNGIVVPNDVKQGAFSKRVIIHPMSAESKKIWPKEKFINLAHRLENQGFEPSLCVSHFERAQWQQICDSLPLPYFSDLDACASYIAEAGYMIGNDSGLGHLASNMGIPTLTLFARKSYSHLWRPGWGPGRVVYPPPFLIGAKLKQRYWKEFLTVERVHKAFTKEREKKRFLPPS